MKKLSEFSNKFLEDQENDLFHETIKSAPASSQDVIVFQCLYPKFDTFECQENQLYTSHNLNFDTREVNKFFLYIKSFETYNILKQTENISKKYSLYAIIFIVFIYTLAIFFFFCEFYRCVQPTLFLGFVSLFIILKSNETILTKRAFKKHLHYREEQFKYFIEKWNCTLTNCHFIWEVGRYAAWIELRKNSLLYDKSLSRKQIVKRITKFGSSLAMNSEFAKICSQDFSNSIRNMRNKIEDLSNQKSSRREEFEMYTSRQEILTTQRNLIPDPKIIDDKNILDYTMPTSLQILKLKKDFPELSDDEIVHKLKSNKMIMKTLNNDLDTSRQNDKSNILDDSNQPFVRDDNLVEKNVDSNIMILSSQRSVVKFNLNQDLRIDSHREIRKNLFNENCKYQSGNSSNIIYPENLKCNEFPKINDELQNNNQNLFATKFSVNDQNDKSFNITYNKDRIYRESNFSKPSVFEWEDNNIQKDSTDFVRVYEITESSKDFEKTDSDVDNYTENSNISELKKKSRDSSVGNVDSEEYDFSSRRNSKENSVGRNESIKNTNKINNNDSSAKMHKLLTRIKIHKLNAINIKHKESETVRSQEGKNNLPFHWSSDLKIPEKNNENSEITKTYKQSYKQPIKEHHSRSQNKKYPAIDYNLNKTNINNKEYIKPNFPYDENLVEKNVKESTNCEMEAKIFLKRNKRKVGNFIANDQSSINIVENDSKKTDELHQENEALEFKNKRPKRITHSELFNSKNNEKNTDGSTYKSTYTNQETEALELKNNRPKRITHSRLFMNKKNTDSSTFKSTNTNQENSEQFYTKCFEIESKDDSIFNSNSKNLIKSSVNTIKNQSSRKNLNFLENRSFPVAYDHNLKKNIEQKNCFNNTSNYIQQEKIIETLQNNSNLIQFKNDPHSIINNQDYEPKNDFEYIPKFCQEEKKISLENQIFKYNEYEQPTDNNQATENESPRYETRSNMVVHNNLLVNKSKYFTEPSLMKNIQRLDKEHYFNENHNSKNLIDIKCLESQKYEKNNNSNACTRRTNDEEQPKKC